MRPAAAKAELSLANAMGQLDAGDGDGRAVEGLEPRHRCAAPFDRSMILLSDVIQILAGSHREVAPARMLFAQQPQRAPTGHVAIECHLARYARPSSGLGPDRTADTCIPTHAEPDDVRIEGALAVKWITGNWLRHSAPPKMFAHSSRYPWMHYKDSPSASIEMTSHFFRSNIKHQTAALQPAS